MKPCLRLTGPSRRDLVQLNQWPVWTVNVDNISHVAGCVASDLGRVEMTVMLSL